MVAGACTFAAERNFRAAALFERMESVPGGRAQPAVGAFWWIGGGDPGSGSPLSLRAGCERRHPAAERPLERECHGDRHVIAIPTGRDLDPQRTLSEALRALGSPVDEFDRQRFLQRMVLVPDGSPLPFRPDVELIDTPPDITTAVEGLERADAVIVPAQPELLAVIALRDMLTFLRDTASRRPHLRILGVLPTAVNTRWEVSRRFLKEIEELADDFRVPVLPPVPESRHVQTFSLRGHLWRPAAERVLAAMAESRAADAR